MKIDVAVNSYKKPESLIYTLMTLKKTAGDLIDTVYINDDCSGGNVCSLYRSPEIQKYFAPWKLDVRENTKNIGIKQIYVRGYYPIYMNWKFLLLRWFRFINPKYGHNRDDIRYQYALDKTDKKYLLILHDDVLFKQDVVSVYLETFQKNPELTLVGGLGQCWRCWFRPFCKKEEIIKNNPPSVYWPKTSGYKLEKISEFDPKKGYSYACRINEWCCMMNVEKARELTEKSKVFFGNMYPKADTGAYWFVEAVRLGYKFTDPLLDNTDQYYKHGWQGFSGHSVWFDQGKGKSTYNSQEIIKIIEQEFGFKWPEIKE